MREFKKEIDEKCLQDEPAFCTAVCPFSLDVRDFIAKMQRGGFGAAYRAYVNAVAFPEIVSQFCDQPCKKACIRGKVDSPVSLKMLEAAAVKYAPNPRPNSYSMPPKNKKIAIIGAGLSGLACALRLASQKYEVTVYEAKNRIGGELWEISPTGDFLEEIERQFQYEDYKLCLGVKVESLSDIQCDAVYIATGKGGENFGAQLTGEGAYATNIQGVFMGGELTGRTLMESLADGLTVIHSIDRYLKTGAMNQPYVSCGTRLAMKTQLIEKVEKANIQGEFLTKEEAVEEAKRCIRCRCDSCLRGCDMMGYFSKYPRRIEEEVEVTIHPGTLDGNGTVATRLISTCNQCGRCKVVCPQGIDVGKFLLANHKIMKSTDAMPWVYHEFWLRDMAFSCSEEAEIFRMPKGTKKSKYAFFPGCRLGGSLPNIVDDTYSALLKMYPDTGLMLSCCGAPSEWAGDERIHSVQIERLNTAWISLGRPILLFACESCRQMFQKYLPQIKGESLYAFLEENGFSLPKQEEKVISVFDPCSSRDNPKAQEAVRSLAKTMGYSVQPLQREGEFAACCSFGGQVSIANPHYAKEVALARIAQNELPYMTYCVNCRDIFASYGKPVFHILEAIFGEIPPDGACEIPTPTESRNNRRSLRIRLCKEFWQEDIVDMEKSKLIISKELHKKLADELILEEDIYNVIKYCEESGRKILDEENNFFVGHRQIGSMTFWAQYRICEDGYLLMGAYCHRMNLAEE